MSATLPDALSLPLDQLLNTLTEATTQRNKVVVQHLLRPLSERMYRKVETMMESQPATRLITGAQYAWFSGAAVQRDVKSAAKHLMTGSENGLLKWIRRQRHTLTPRGAYGALSRLLSSQPLWMEAAEALVPHVLMEDRSLIFEEDDIYPRNDRSDRFLENLAHGLPETERALAHIRLLGMAAYGGRLALTQRLVPLAQANSQNLDHPTLGTLEDVLRRALNEANAGGHTALTQWLMTEAPQAARRLIEMGVKYQDHVLTDRLLQQAPATVLASGLSCIERLEQSLDDFPLTQARLQAEARAERSPVPDALKIARRRRLT